TLAAASVLVERVAPLRGSLSSTVTRARSASVTALGPAAFDADSIQTWTWTWRGVGQSRPKNLMIAPAKTAAAEAAGLANVGEPAGPAAAGQDRGRADLHRGQPEPDLGRHQPVTLTVGQAIGGLARPAGRLDALVAVALLGG